MTSIHGERAAPAGSGNGSLKNVGLASATNDTDTSVSVARQALTQLTDKLAVMADWRDELHAKHRRAMLLLDLGHITLEEAIALEDEIARWRQAADALAVSIKRRAAR